MSKADLEGCEMAYTIEQLACSQHDKTQHYREGEGEKLKGRHDDESWLKRSRLASNPERSVQVE
ncbi:hypothetical protein TRAPUB_8648 [Trametes pubescens]|uniref:Uncharacterized protein n=1 Tax=Trametes pubescens TaxID=154538 RepID=A0A1M2W4J9_TRAPU|nr:hypothetical protein TRAPUB_8648 [Trametes pubescens]